MNKTKTNTKTKTNNDRVLHSLQELEQVRLAPLPELPEVELGDLAALEAQAESVRKAAGQVREWVRSTLNQLDLVGRASREAQELLAPKVAEAQESLEALFHHEIPAYRRVAWMGFLENELSRELNSRTEVEELLEGLVEEGWLEERPDGDLKAFGQTFSVHSGSLFEEPEVREVKRFLSALLNRVFQETGKLREEKAQELRETGIHDLNQLLSGTPGKYVVEVPPERVTQDDREFWRGGGTLLVESDGQDIFPLDAAGSIEGAVKEAREIGIFLKAYTLSWEKAPVVPGLDPEKGRKVQLLWYLLKRTIRYQVQAERIACTKEDFATRQTITDQEFFLERKSGICLAEFSWPWQNPDGSAGPSNIFFLMERKENEEGTSIRIMDVPEHLNEFFADCLDEEFLEKGNKFEGLPQPLRAVLKAIFGQVSKEEFADVANDD